MTRAGLFRCRYAMPHGVVHTYNKGQPPESPLALAAFNDSINRASGRRVPALKRHREEALHRRVMKQDPAQHSKVPNIMAAARIVEPSAQPSLGNLSGIDDGADEVDGDALDDRGVKVPRPLTASGPAELEHGREACGREGDVEGHAGPVHVCAVEGWMPWQDNACDAKGGSHDHVYPSAYRLAIESCILRRHDAGRDQEAYPRVVYTCKTLHQILLRDTAHGMPHATADQALAGSEEKDGGEEYVGSGRLREIDRGGVEVEGDCEDNEEADGVRPDVDKLVVEIER